MKGCSLVVAIAGSDKTTVSIATGQNEYYPLYMSLGGVENVVRRADRGAVVVVAFLAIPASRFLSSLLRHAHLIGLKMTENMIPSKSIALSDDKYFTLAYLLSFRVFDLT